MKKIYSLVVAALAITTIANSQKTWTGPTTGGSWTQGNNWSGGTIPVSTDDVVLGGGISGTITNVPDVSLRSLTISEVSTVTLAYSGAGAAHKLTILNSNGNAALDLVVQAGSTLILGGTNFTGIELANNADASIAGTLTVNAGRSLITGGGNSVTTVTGFINNFGTVSTSNGSLVVANNGTYVHSRNGGVIPLATWEDNSNCTIEGVVDAIPSGYTQEFGNFEWNSGSQTGAVTFSGGLGDMQGNFKVTSTGTGSIRLATSQSFSTTVFGDYIQTGGTVVINQTGGNGVLRLEGNFTMSGGSLAKNSATGASTVDFEGGTEQTFTKTGGTFSGPLTFEVSDGSIVNFGTSVLDAAAATFRINEGGTFITAHPAGLNSAGAVGPIQTAVRTFSNHAVYEFRGAATGIFNTGASTNTTASEVAGLIINNTTGNVTLSKPVTIVDLPSTVQRLHLKNGALLTTATNVLTLNDNVQATGIDAETSNTYNLTSFVDGPMIKVGNDDFTFPVGKVGSGLHRIGVDMPSTGTDVTTYFTAQYFRNDPSTLSTTLGAGLARISGCEYWTLDRANSNPFDPAPNAARVILSWETNSGCGGQYVTDLTALTVARLNAAGTWVNEGRQAGGNTGDKFAGTIGSLTMLTNFSPFALASSSALVNPLPVVFGDVKAFEKNDGVQIDWSNLTEKDVTEYTVERSANGKDFEPIATQWPTSNQDDRVDYTAFDANPIQSTNYYRIKVIEADGKIVYSRILSININRNGLGLTLYPNPVKDNQVTISMSNMKRGPYNLRVVNATGQDIFIRTIVNQSSSFTQTLNLPSSVRPGVYSMIITADGYRTTKMFIVH